MWAAGVALRFRSIQAGPLMQTPDLHDPVPRARSTCRWTCSAAGCTTVAEVNPVTAMVEAGRDLISGGEPDCALAFGAALGLCVLGALVGGARPAPRRGRRRVSTPSPAE